MNRCLSPGQFKVWSMKRFFHQSVSFSLSLLLSLCVCMNKIVEKEKLINAQF